MRFAITDIGDWTTVDMDGNNTYGIGNGAGSYFDYPNALAPKSFMVFNAKESGVAVYDSTAVLQSGLPIPATRCLYLSRLRGRFRRHG